MVIEENSDRDVPLSYKRIIKFMVCKQKLESKKEALLILSKELDTCQQERDQYKLMANQLRERHQGLKKKYRELIVRLMFGYLVLDYRWL